MTLEDDRPPLRDRVIGQAALKGLAHPIRMRLLNELADRFSATSAQLAAALGESRGSTSYHLRQLERHGFVVDDPTRGTQRERYWTQRPGGWMVPAFDLAQEPASAAAVDVMMRETLLADQRRTMTAMHRARHWPQEWRDASRRRDTHLSLTARDAAALIAELDAVIDRYQEKGTPPAAGARRVSTVFTVTPTEHGVPA